MRRSKLQARGAISTGQLPLARSDTYKKAAKEADPSAQGEFDL